jgi:hypothetical protein
MGVGDILGETSKRLRIAASLLLLSFILFPLALFAQTVQTFAVPAAISVPVDTVQTCKAIVNGSLNQAVTWSSTGGMLSAGQDPNTEGITSASTGTFTLTATSVADGTKTASCVVTFTGDPSVATTYPRLILPASQVATMQAKGLTSNPLYSAIFTPAQAAYTADSAIWTFSTWSGSACTGGSGPSSDQSQNFVENDAFWMAQVALMDNSSSNRNQYGCPAHDVFMTNIEYAINGEFKVDGNRMSGSADQFALTADLLLGGGYLSSADQAVVRNFLAVVAYDQVNSFYGSEGVIGSYNSATQFTNFGDSSYVFMRAMGNNYTQSRMLILTAAALQFDDNTSADPLMPTGGVVSAPPQNQGSTWTVGEQFTIGSGAAVGQCTAVSGGACTATEVITASTGYNNTSNPLSTTATSGSGTGLTVNIVALNTCGAARGTLCPDGSGGDLHAYWGYMTGAMLYKYWANEEDPGITQQAYNAAYANLPSNPSCSTEWGGTAPCMGSSQGGEASEGTFYGNAFAGFIQTAIAIQNAGYFNPSLYGPQMSALTSSYNDQRILADYTAMTGMSGLQAEPARWNFLTNGDSDNNYVYPASYSTESTMLMDDYLSGRTDRANNLEWIVLNSAWGGADGTHSCTMGPCGFINSLADPFGEATLPDIFIALPAGNPVTVNPPTDPRATLPTDWYDIGNQHIAVRDNGWATGTGTIFSTYCTNTHIDHEHGFCGGFDVYSNGEYIAKGRTEFNDYNDAMSAAMYKQTAPALQFPGQTTCTVNPSSNFCSYWEGFTFGGEMWHGTQGGVATLLHSDSPVYVASTADDTVLNTGAATNSHYSPFNQTSLRSTSQIYLRGSQQVITYNRVATGTNSWNKSNFFVTTGAPTISGGTATWLTRSGTQKAAWTPLLPAGATFTNARLPQYVTITAAHSTLNSGSTMQATCTVTYADGSTADVSSLTGWAGNLTWTVDTPTVATVASAGLITPVAAGSFNLRCGWLGVYGNAPITITSGSSSGTTNVVGDQDQLDDWEPYTLVQVDAGNATSTNFLSVLQWGASSFTPATATAVTSSSGQTFDGTLVGTTLAMFMRVPATFTGVTFPASSATTLYVADLTPNTSYTVSGAGTPGSCTTDPAGVCTFSATGTGNISVSPGGVAAPPVNLTGTISITGSAVIR